MFTNLSREARMLVKQVVQLAFYMNGAISYDDIMWRTPGERDIISEFLTEKAEAEAKAYRQSKHG